MKLPHGSRIDAYTHLKDGSKKPGTGPAGWGTTFHPQRPWAEESDDGEQLCKPRVQQAVALSARMDAFSSLMWQVPGLARTGSVRATWSITGCVATARRRWSSSMARRRALWYAQSKCRPPRWGQRCFGIVDRNDTVERAPCSERVGSRDLLQPGLLQGRPCKH